MLSTKHKFLFIHIPKTGGNAIQKSLLPFSDDQVVFTNDMHDGIDRFEIRSQSINIHKHSSLEDYRSQLDKQTFEELLKITCVRNPWDRCVSFFFSPHRGPVDWSEVAFAEFIKSTIKPHAHFLKTSTFTSNYFDNIDFYIRFEQISEDFKALCEKLQIDSLQLPHINKSNRQGYQQYYKSQETIDLVSNIFRDEIDHFQYTF
ncbi:sulfotransferase family 2 domain-containing protein [Alteromonas sp. 1_MG-2023]|uniref:sulfotransferase family 2 domain-containing protein n=1 Tax=Alteromonas sp. 1_MG-2023 TaxID=3062669 RepID=UPI0026E46C5C|nr:sulfotransferase family 2 domain-containing protein [Alteromonas sp. 1_MG-2023]MDO6567903.1 sulfotransferase family 2 domain-containing protein [Alteromonas sp. 1_MG-2023]